MSACISSAGCVFSTDAPVAARMSRGEWAAWAIVLLVDALVLAVLS